MKKPVRFSLKSVKNKYIELVLAVIVLSVASFLFLSNLSNRYLWQDEAQTALVSKTVLKHGLPLGYDGKNYFSQELGAEYGKNYIWKWQPWLPFYLVAASFKVLGINTFSARLPFAIFGIATIALMYLFSKSLCQNNKMAFISPVLLMFSVPFLILSRQCRYYSLAAFFSLWGLYNYLNLLENKKHAAIAFFISLTLLFHVHYVYYAALLVTVLIHTFLFHRNYIKKISALAAGSIVVNLPWIVLFSSAGYYKNHGPGFLSFPQFLKFMASFLGDIAACIFPGYLLLIIAFVIVYGWIKKRAFLRGGIKPGGVALLLIFLFVNLILLSAFSIVPFFRYLTPLIPIFCMITALIILSVINLRCWAGILLMIAVIFSGPIVEYFYEITHNYDGPIKGIVQYLRQNGAEDDLVAITYGDLPVKFYTNMRVVGGLTGEDLSSAVNAKWVILRKYTICGKDSAVKQEFLKNIPWASYKKIVINYPDIPIENSESPAWHYYSTALDEDRVIIYERVQSPAKQ